MIDRTSCSHALPLVILVLCAFAVPEAHAESLVLARNGTTPTLCAEHDNICVGLSVPLLYTIESFKIEARHPQYEWTVDHTDPDFTNCEPGTEPVYHFSPRTLKIADTGKTAVVAVTEPVFWRPRGMTAIGSTTATDVHYIAVHRELHPGHWPQVLVIYADGYVRPKPFPPEGVSDTVFGSSIIVGPIQQSTRPFATIDSLRFVPASDGFEITYDDGQSVVLAIESLTREALRLHVDTSGLRLEESQRFANFRSMIVEEGNADADHMRRVDETGMSHNEPIIDFVGGLGSEFLLHREEWSKHNTSAPDIWVGDFQVVPEPPTFCSLLVGSGFLLGYWCVRLVRDRLGKPGRTSSAPSNS